ncbi:LOW QUALITY PROTEIN: uncharacterized protein ACNLHF_019235 [Anomaloglossus baeobatrachus]
MPCCIVNQCFNTSGRTGPKKDIKLHKFPNDIDRIIAWLNQTGEQFIDIQAFASTILSSGKNGKYAICSEHFTPDSYDYRGSIKFLKKNAIPTLFPTVIKGEKIVEESSHKDKNRGRKRFFTQLCSQGSITAVAQEEEVSNPRFRNCSTQTDSTLLNSKVMFEPVVDFSANHLSALQCPPSTSTPIAKKDLLLSGSLLELSSPLKKKTMRTVLFENDGAECLENLNILSPVSGVPNTVPGSQNTSFEESMEPIPLQDPDYVPHLTSLEESDLCISESLLPDSYHVPPVTVRNVTEEQVVEDRKLLVFESCLDNLIRKVKCQHDPMCKSTVSSFKIYEGSFCKIIGRCFQGHKFTIFESQPKIGKLATGNVLIAASILFSGLNFQKVKEFFNLLGFVSISEVTYYRYQSMFLFPAIDHAWTKEKEEFKQKKIQHPLCVSGDGQCDSPGHNAKYCIYTIMDIITDKIMDFEVVQRSQCSSSVAMEKFGFQKVLDRLISSGYKIKIFAPDRHVGIRKKMREDFPQINHQFDIWHYAKSLKKKLTTASHGSLCKGIIPWIEKIVLHFWWCVTTCEQKEQIFREKWLSLLHHITNQHEWDGEVYRKCGHVPIEMGDEEIFWLINGTPPFNNIERIVSNDKMLKDIPHLVLNCHTGQLENFHSMALKYRTKRIHFGIDAMEARTKLAALTHNKNVGREQAVVRFERKNTESKGTKRTKLVAPKSQGRWVIKKCMKRWMFTFSMKSALLF